MSTSTAGTLKKHRQDVLVLSGQLTDDPIELPESIQNDMKAFLLRLAQEEVDLKSIGLKGTLESYIERLALNFGLQMA
ncbi:hypothetical protein TOC8172_41010 [Pseudomonas syringae]